jgi:hypothetical protein
VKILGRIDELATLLNEAQARNFRRWRILDHNIWPNAFVGKSFNDEISFLKQWIRQRIEWMDQEFMLPPSFSTQAGTVNRGAKLELRARQEKSITPWTVRTHELRAAPFPMPPSPTNPILCSMTPRPSFVAPRTGPAGAILLSVNFSLRSPGHLQNESLKRASLGFHQSV